MQALHIYIFIRLTQDILFQIFANETIESVRFVRKTFQQAPILFLPAASIYMIGHVFRNSTLTIDIDRNASFSVFSLVTQNLF